MAPDRTQKPKLNRYVEIQADGPVITISHPNAMPREIRQDFRICKINQLGLSSSMPRKGPDNWITLPVELVKAAVTGLA